MEAVDYDGDGVSAASDCDDFDPQTYPGAPEQCDLKDNDCDGQLAQFEYDLDGDGFIGCYECNDLVASINPDAEELPGNFIDENCDGDLGNCDPCYPWRNHGKYVSCVVHATQDLVDGGFPDTGTKAAS